MKYYTFLYCLSISLLLQFGCCGDVPVSVRPSRQPVQTDVKTESLPNMPKNFHRVSADIYRCGQPTKKEMASLVAVAGVKSVLNLRDFHSDKDEVGRLAVNLYEIPLKAGSLTEQDIYRILKTIQTAPKPIVIHCWHGSDRTGAAVAACRIVFEGWSVEEAIEELKRPEFGHHERLYANIPKLIRQIDWTKMKNRLARESGFNAADGDAPL